MKGLKVLVVQLGARRAYELATMLHERGALASLQTGAAWPDGSSPFLGRILPSLNSAISRRTVHGLPREKLRRTYVPEAFGAVAKVLGVRSDIRFALEDWVLGKICRFRGLTAADVVLSTMGNGGPSFLSWARNRGAKIATDVFISPLADQIESEEQANWPGWDAAPITDRQVAASLKRAAKIVELSDLLICPSETVIRGLQRIPGFTPKKACLLPYGLGDVRIGAGVPEPRRVLFAGTANLRKGIPYLALAASSLRRHGYQVRVAGPVSPAIRAKKECCDLVFLDKLSRIEMMEELSRADVFCLPSLAEGMASVTLEALAKGVPCVVTAAAGSPVTHRHDGMIVPERDPLALAEAIRTICEDRPLREDMSKLALGKAQIHSSASIGDRLYKELSKLRGQ